MPDITRSYLLAKRYFDLMVLLLASPFLIPLTAAVALAIRLDTKGPIVFSQERTGQHGRRFRMYKFRTMVPNAEELKAHLAHLNVLEPPDFKIPDDPRITRVGRFLRRTSLDELPQLWNVLRGEMSLVGPRPTSFAADTYLGWHTQRLEVPPGLTGLWQIDGRHDCGFDERLRLDARYIREMSLLTDIRIIWATAFSVVAAKGA